MQMVKIKFCDRNITFANNPRFLWICGSTQILVSQCRMWTSRLSRTYPLSPSPFTQECFTYCRCAIKFFDIVSGVIFNFTSQTLYIMVITLSKVAAIKFLTEEGVACEIEDEVSVYLKIHYSDLCKLYKVNCLIFIVRIENYIYIYIYYSNLKLYIYV